MMGRILYQDMIHEYVFVAVPSKGLHTLLYMIVTVSFIIGVLPEKDEWFMLLWLMILSTITV
jgi:hypothetical protein